MAQRMALLQACSHPSAVVDGYSEVPAKLLALDSLLQELIERRREKVIVWSFYRFSLDAIWTRYQRYHPVRFDGSVSDTAARRDAVRKFQDDDETMLFLGNPAAAGAGITLHRARYAVYESMSNQAAHYLQSLDRIHRRGQRREVEYIVLLCANTLEENEYARLLRKQVSAQELLGDDIIEPPTRRAMLREAIDAAKALGILGLEPRTSEKDMG
jgi:SNF2 family DNA or RNA helicase